MGNWLSYEEELTENENKSKETKEEKQEREEKSEFECLLKMMIFHFFMENEL
jgi:hypothetical protein